MNKSRKNGDRDAWLYIGQTGRNLLCLYILCWHPVSNAIISQTNIEKDLDDLRSVLITLIRVLPCHC